ncbi:Biopolymer transport protein [Teredinibacter turnerae T7901]|uniref:Biopolymer transport protein n=1 Tax=Teredinibacter turnerae (strain ATCC 39867 / T7901) TaxID=377629 RepID=C5BL30_TERTT|nr:biopolymer transporter ExbD [Teredinibacter turnerae]ACR13400.1 Biopolymer transport protein [Teredinibacter turnerae T7901]
MQFKRQVKTEDSINLTPLIDVVFLLLIFFMVSTTFTKETHLKIDLPEAVGELQTVKADQIEVVINAQGGLAINGRSLVNSRTNTLRAAIEEVSQGDSSMPMIITGDAATPYQAIISVMDLAGQMGFANLSLTTQQPQEGGDTGGAQ